MTPSALKRMTQPPALRRLGATKAALGTLAVAGITVPAEVALRAITFRNRNYLPIWFHRGLARSLGVKIICHGRPAGSRGVLYVANHLSWADIPVLGARIDAAFVAKSEVAGWGPVGWLASFANTVYVARDRRHSAGAQKSAIAQRLASGQSVILFPEGTNSDGVDVLPFKSALFSVIDDVDVQVQPVTLAYTRVNGLPVTRRQLPDLAWVGDTGLGGHALGFARLGRVQAEIMFHPPVDRSAFADRKALARHCERVIADGYRRLMRSG